jgi:hypothetical protein
VEPERGKRGTGVATVPPVLHLRQQTMPKRRLRLPATNRTFDNCAENRENLINNYGVDNTVEKALIRLWKTIEISTALLF